MIINKRNSANVKTDYGEDFVVQVSSRDAEMVSLVNYTGSDVCVVIPSGIKRICSYAFMACRDIKMIVIPDTVVEIQSCAFELCTHLVTAHIPASVNNIGANAFKGCENLRELTVDEENPVYFSSGNRIILTETKEVIQSCAGSFEPTGEDENEILYIGGTLAKVSESFHGGCVTVKEGTKNIAAQAFKDCLTLTDVIIPDSVTRIGREAFGGCVNLKFIQLSSNIAELGDGILSGCEKLEEIHMPYIAPPDQEEGAQVFDPSFLFGNAESPGAYPVTRKHNHTATYYIPLSLSRIRLREGVERIGKEAFSGYRSLKSIFISKTVKSISEDAFADCDELRDVEISEDNPYLEREKSYIVGKFDLNEGAESEAFEYDDGVRIENGVVYRGETLFKVTKSSPASCIIKPGTQIIRRRAFQNCKHITDVVIPDGVTKIGAEAFSGCVNLKNVFIPDSVTEIEQSVFAGCGSLEDMRLPCIMRPLSSADKFSIWRNLEFTWLFDTVEYPNSYGVKFFLFAEYFIPCSLRSLTIGNNIECLTGLSGFKSLTSVNIPDTVTEIGEEAFSFCTSLENVKIPNSVVSIGKVAFRSCEALRKIVIPWSVAKIGKSAFAGCVELDFVSLPKGVEVAEDAFENCPKLKEISYRD